MFNNIPNDDIIPHIGEKDIEDGMQNVNINRYNRLETPLVLNPENATFQDIYWHMIVRQRLSPSTVKNHMNYARFMETHIIPVNFRKPCFTDFMKHMDYREQIEHAGSHALAQEWLTMQKFLIAYNIPFGLGTTWNYKPPSRPPSRPQHIPLPNTVYQQLHHQYTHDEYNNSLLQYTLTHEYLIGWRNPSETILMKTTDIDLDNGIITITEKKKHYKKRIIAPDHIILHGKTRKSFKNWIDHWRNRVENQHSKDYLYLRKNGKPLHDSQYRMFLNKYVKPIYPWYHPYISRHWCAIAKLIQTKIETEHYDEYQVRNWLGHEQIQTTMDYIRDAEQYYKLAPYDWFKRVLKNHHRIVEENTLKSKPEGFTPVSTGNPPRDNFDLSWNRNQLSKEFHSKYTNMLVFLNYLIKPFLFSLDNIVGVGA